MIKWLVLGFMALSLSTACNRTGKGGGQGAENGTSPDGTGSEQDGGGKASEGGAAGTSTEGGQDKGSGGAEGGTSPDATAPGHYTILNDSVDMILHISSGNNSVSIGPGKCAALKQDYFTALHIQESDAGWGWYLFTGDMFYYDTLCGDGFFSDSCPKKAAHHRYLGDGQALVPTTEPAKNCISF